VHRAEDIGTAERQLQTGMISLQVNEHRTLLWHSKTTANRQQNDSKTTAPLGCCLHASTLKVGTKLPSSASSCGTSTVGA
jgi:hypothetical protein